MSKNRVRRVVMISLLSAIAVSIVVSGVSKYLPFPILTYLKFDPAEIPAFIALFMLDYKAALGVSIVHYIFLLWFGEFTPIGPTMKFLAVISTIFGWELVGMFSSNTIARLVSASITRALVMTIANIYVLLFIFPDFICYAGRLLGYSECDVWTVLPIMLGLTAVYNVLHVLVLNYFVSKIIADRVSAVIKF